MKRVLSILLMVSLLLISTTTVSAANINDEEIGIVPFDSTLIVQLSTQSENIIYYDSTNLLFSETIEVSNDSYNIGAVTIRILNQADGSAIGEQTTIQPGETAEFKVPANTDYFVGATAVSENGGYAMYVNKGNQSGVYSIVQLTSGASTTVWFGDLPRLLPTDLTITNHIFSPVSVELYVVRQSTGTLIGEQQTVAPGETATWRLPTDLLGDSYVVYGTPTADNINIAQTCFFVVND